MSNNSTSSKVSLSCKVVINGNELEKGVDITAVSVHKQFAKIASAEVVLYYGSISYEEFVDDINADIVVGSELEIYADEKDLCVFKGVIVKKGVSLSNRHSLLTLTAKNKAYKMTLNRNNRIFTEVKDCEVIEELIQKYAIDCEVDSTTYKNEFVTQYSCSDWDFINMKAEANSLLVCTDDDKITVKKPKIGAAKFEINGYESIIDFDAQLDGRTSFSDYKANSWNYNTQEKQQVEKSNSSSDFQQGNQQNKDLSRALNNESFMMNFNSYFADEDTITEKVKSVMMRNNLSRIIGRVKLYGVCEIKPGETISFSGIGKSFNGESFVSETLFSFEKGAWITSIGFGLEETSYYRLYDDVNIAPATELTPAVHGLQIGKIEALEGDPAGDFRVKISFPCFEGDNTEVWARWSTIDAGNKRGYFFLPELGDEVVIGFVDQNPNNPIVLGTLYSNKIPAPESFSDDNNKKGFYLKSGIKVLFNEEDKIISIATPAKNQIVLNDKDGKIELGDANGNKIVMNSEGISIKSAGKITMEATSDMNLKGVNLKTEASASYKASGGANAEVSSSGIMILKGSLVQIN